MKNFLAVDTGSKYMTVLACVGGKTYVRFEEDCAMRHSVRLMPTVDEVLKEAGATPADFDFFACVVGAGSFTGIRIGIATAKGFALATGKPTMPITSFDLAAYTVKDGKILVLSDALHGAYYAAAYENGRQALAPSYITEEEALSWREKGFIPCSAETVFLGGEEAVRFDPVTGLYDAVCALREKNAFGELNALYIRKSQAEINLEKGQGV